MDISVIIPAFNEEKFISNTIESIIKWMPECFQFEIIVVDHGSSDKTAVKASVAGATVVDGKHSKTIAALRNLGVKNSVGQALFFVDADITFTEEWSSHISQTVRSLENKPYQICGSLPRVPEQSSFLMKRWFEPKSMVRLPNYIGSGHLITSRELFDKIHGFPENLETGEDCMFCLKAINVGAKITARPELVVIHHGAPKTLLQFVKREAWHGRGDWSSFGAMKSSRVAHLTLVFLVLHVLLASSFFVSESYATSFSVLVVTIILLCLVSSFYKFFRNGFTYAALNSITFYFYLFARALSLFSFFFFSKVKKRSRTT
jgi:glycosyltransferase involved in cell wall biosynthesis